MFSDAIEAVQAYISLGGFVIYFIAALAFLMWTLILERIFYYYGGGLNRDVTAAIDSWEARSERVSWHAHKIREKLISEVSEDVNTLPANDQDHGCPGATLWSSGYRNRHDQCV